MSKEKFTAEDLVDYVGDRGDVIQNMLLHAIEGVIHERDYLIDKVESPIQISQIRNSAKNVICQYISTWGDLCTLWEEISDEEEPLEFGIGIGYKVDVD